MEGLNAMDIKRKTKRGWSSRVLVIRGALAIDLQHGGSVADAVAKVGGSPERHELAAKELLVAVEAERMASDERGDVVGVEEAVEDVAAKGGHVGLGVSASAGLGIGGLSPQQVEERALGLGLAEAGDDTDLVQVLGGRRGDAAMERQPGVVDQRGDGEVVKGLGEVAPWVGGGVLAHALAVEPVDLRETAALVVPSQQCDPVWVAELEREQQSHAVDRELAEVDVIPQKQVVCVGHEPRDLEELDQVEKVPVDVPNDGEW